MAGGRPAELWLLSGTMLLDALAVSLVLPVLPVVAADLGLGPAGAQWVMSAFAVGFAALLLPGPVLAARWGPRRTYLLALGGLAAAAVVAAAVPHPVVLVATRVVQGACAALTAPTGLAVIAATRPAGPARRRAMAVYTTTGAAGFTVGLLLSGAVATAHWRWVLLVPAVAGAALALVAARVLPADQHPTTPAPSRPPTAARSTPVLATTCAALVNGTFLSILLLTAFTLDDPPQWLAVALLPASLPAVMTALAGSALLGRFGPAPLVAVGTAVLAAGCVLWSTSSGDTVSTSLTLALVGLGFAPAFIALNALAAASAGNARQAIAVYQFGVQCGAALLLVLTGHLGAAGPTAVVALGVLAAGTGLAVIRTRDGTAPRSSAPPVRPPTTRSERLSHDARGDRGTAPPPRPRGQRAGRSRDGAPARQGQAHRP